MTVTNYYKLNTEKFELAGAALADTFFDITGTSLADIQEVNSS